jgi:hypothetical protein
MTTNTPRTDSVFWKFHTHEDMVNLARDLERDLIATRAALDQMTEDAVEWRRKAENLP